MRQRDRRAGNHEVQLAGDEIEQSRPGTPIGDERKARAGSHLKEGCRHVGRAADAAGPRRCLVGISFQPFDQFGKRVRREVLAGDDQVGFPGKQRNRIEVPQEIIGERINGAIGDMRTPIAGAERITVRGCTHDATDADTASRPGDIFDHYGLAERIPKPLRHDPHHHVERPARRIRHVHGDGPRRIGLRRASARQGANRRRSRG